MPETTGPDTIARVLAHEQVLRTNEAAYSADDIAALDLDPYWKQVLLLFEVHRQITHDKVDQVDARVLAALDPGLRWLLGHRWAACAEPGGHPVNGKPRESGAVVEGVDWERWSVILCKPDAVDRGLVDDVLGRLAAPSVEIVARTEVQVQPWQIHVHYWDLLVDRDWFPDRDIPACLDAEYAGRTVVVALAYGRRGIQGWMRAQLGSLRPDGGRGRARSAATSATTRWRGPWPSAG